MRLPFIFQMQYADAKVETIHATGVIVMMIADC